MPKYTETEPFEFEGVKVWREFGVFRWGALTNNVEAEGIARALHAFIEAERNEWHYTNADKTEARKGRFTAVETDSHGWRFAHDELPGFTAHRSAPDSVVRGFDVVAIGFEAFKGVIDEFEAWHAAQQQQEEPTGLGAVVEVAELEPREPGATECFVCTGKSSHNPKPWALAEDRHIRADWQHLLTRGPVTVLSPGIES